MAAGAGVLRQLLAVFSFETDTTGLDKGQKKLREWVGDMKKVAATFAGGAIAKGIGHFVKDTVDEMMNIRKGAMELKITTDEMQQLQSAARATGMDVKWLHFTLERLEVNVERSGHGAKRQAEAMKLLGIRAKDAAGRVYSAKELFLQFADGFDKVKSQNVQARAVWDLMGRGAHRLLPLLRMGRQRIEELMSATEEYGKYQKEEIEQAAKYTVTLEHLRLVWMSIKGFIMSQWLPILEKQTNGLIKAGKWVLSMAKHSLLAKAALQMLQVAMAGLALKMMVAYPWATALLGALTALTLIWDDILVMFEGGHSLIGDTLDKLFGKGASASFVEHVRDLWRDIAQFTRESWGYVKNILGIKDAEPDINGPGPWSPAVLDLRERGKKKAAALALEKGETRTASFNNAKVGMDPAAPSGGQWMSGMAQLGAAIGSALYSGTFGNAGRLMDTVGKMAAGDWEEHFPITVNVTAPPGADARQHGQIAGAAAAEEIQKRIKDAAASLRREKH